MADLDARNEIQDAIRRLRHDVLGWQKRLEERVQEYRFHYLVRAAQMLEAGDGLDAAGGGHVRDLRNHVVEAKAEIERLEGQIERLETLLARCNNEGEFRQELAERLDI